MHYLAFEWRQRVSCDHMRISTYLLV